MARTPNVGVGSYTSQRTRERLQQGQGVDIKRIKYPTLNRLLVPDVNRRSPFGPVAVQVSLKVGDCLIGPQAWPSANRALFTPFEIQTDIVELVAINIAVGGTGGNLDVGIYDRNGIRLFSDGGSACGSNANHRFTVPNLQLQEGSYYLSGASNGVAILVFMDPSYTSFDMVGAKTMDSAYPLPATATLATPLSGLFCGALEFAPR